MKRKIVIACQSAGYLIRDIANAYINDGSEVTLIISEDTTEETSKGLDNRVVIDNIINYDKSSSVKRIFTWTYATLQIWIKLFLHHRSSFVLYVSNPPFGPLLPLILNNNFSILIWDVYPDVLVSQNVFSSQSYLIKWWSNNNKKVYSKAKCIYTISRGMKDCLTQYVNSDKIRMVPLWPDGCIKKVDESHNLFIKEQELEGKFVVLYSGNLGNTHRMDVLLDVAKAIHDEDFVILIVGDGGKKKMIADRIKKENITNVRLLPFQPLDILPHSLSSADIAVVTLDTLSSKMSVPSKTFNLMTIGVPLLCIASPDSELGNIVRQYKAGDVFSPDDINGMVTFIRKIKRDKELKEKISHNSFQASRHFTKDNASLFVE